jgi:hypothetical protein
MRMHDTVAESWTRLGECFGDLFASYSFLLVRPLKSPFFSFQFRPAVILAWKVRGSSQGKKCIGLFWCPPNIIWLCQCYQVRSVSTSTRATQRMAGVCGRHRSVTSAINLCFFRVIGRLQSDAKAPIQIFLPLQGRRQRRKQAEDWEIGQLYWNCLERYGKDQAVDKVRQKYMDDFVKTKDLYLFLGTTYEWHIRKARNPFVIIGTFHPPHLTQPSLL